MDLRTIPRGARRTGRQLVRRVSIEADWLASRRGRADLGVFHEFSPPPSGGGNQFMRALTGEFASRGYELEHNRLSSATTACLFNSFNFDFERLRRFACDGCRMVHRVDGPVGVYRGFDDGTDARVAEINRELATATVFQSRFSLDKHLELGYELRDPVLIGNAVDPSIFHPPARRDPLEGRKVRLIATSWSANPRKGADTFAWLNRNLDWSRYELTFVGQSPVTFGRICMVGPVDSHGVADLLRGHDVYVAASEDDPASNSVLEALACGLPAVFRQSGGHPELVGEAGVPFLSDAELPEALDHLVAEVDARRAAISTPSIASVADRYLEVLGLARPGAA